MPTQQEIISKIKSAVRFPELTEKVDSEIEKMKTTDTMDGKKTNLEWFYEKWQQHIDEIGTANNQNSWTAYAIGATTIKPSGDFLIDRDFFARPSPPDIDTDIQDTRRHELIEHEIELFGRDRVCNVSTRNQLKFKSAITRIAKALDIANAYYKGSAAYTTDNNALVREILDSLPSYKGILKIRGEDGKEHVINSCELAMKYCPDFAKNIQRFPEILVHIKEIEGLVSGVGCHASALVISDVPLNEIAPLRTTKEDSGEIHLATEFPYEDVESLGLIKFDFLGLRTLSIIEKCLKLIGDYYGEEAIPNIYEISTDDPKIYELYRSGNLVGIFQCESAGMQKTCVKIQVDSFEDVMAAISLYRPGPMDFIDDFSDKKLGRKPMSYFHPLLEPYLKKYLERTYSVIVYQEQLMFIFMELGNLSFTQGYGLIKGVAKKQPDIIAKYKKLLIDSTFAYRGIPKEIMESYWVKVIEPFAGYAFNLAHSAGYGLLSVITAYLKTYYPEEFMAAILSIESQIKNRDFDWVHELEQETQKLGIRILPKDINKCEVDYKIVTHKDKNAGIMKSEIRPTLLCESLSIKAAQNIVDCRPYTSMIDFAKKTDISLVTAKHVEALSDAGFFKGKKEKLLEEFKMAREDKKNQRGRQDTDIFA